MVKCLFLTMGLIKHFFFFFFFFNTLFSQTCVTLELTYNAPDGTIGNWEEDMFEDVGRFDNATCDAERPLVDQSDNESLASATSRSLRGSRLSVTSRGSHTAKSPTKGYVVRAPSYRPCSTAMPISRRSLAPPTIQI